jgi:hypothetical protein
VWILNRRLHVGSSLITPKGRKRNPRPRATQRVVDAVDARGGQTNKRSDTFFGEIIHDTIAPCSLLSLIMQRYMKGDHITSDPCQIGRVKYPQDSSGIHKQGRKGCRIMAFLQRKSLQIF